MTSRGAAVLLGCTLLLGAGYAADRPRAANGALASAAARYLAIANAGNRRLQADLDPFEGRDRNNLIRAKADLRDAAATERLFDGRLLAIAFPPAVERVARELYRVNEARARLTTGAAASTSLRWLHSYLPPLDAANGRVEQAVKTIRRLLGLPPPPTS